MPSDSRTERTCCQGTSGSSRWRKIGSSPGTFGPSVEFKGGPRPRSCRHDCSDLLGGPCAHDPTRPPAARASWVHPNREGALQPKWSLSQGPNFEDLEAHSIDPTNTAQMPRLCDGPLRLCARNRASFGSGSVDLAATMCRARLTSSSLGPARKILSMLRIIRHTFHESHAGKIGTPLLGLNQASSPGSSDRQIDGSLKVRWGCANSG